jgi:hypothetical protein
VKAASDRKRQNTRPGLRLSISGMDSLSIPPYTLRLGVDGRIMAEHPQLREPVEVPAAMLLRVIKSAARQSLDFPGRVTEPAQQGA